MWGGGSMAVTFTRVELEGIQEASARLLSVLDHEDPDAWARSVMAVVRPLIGADRLSGPMSGDHLLNRAPPADHEDTGSWREFCLRFGLPDASELAVDGRRLSVSPLIDAGHEGPEGGGTDLRDVGLEPRVFDGRHGPPESAGLAEKQVAILRLLFPSYRVAVEMARRARGRPEVLADVDRLPTALLLLDEGGGILYRNHAFRRRVTGEHEAAVVDAARDLVAGGSLLRSPVEVTGNGHRRRAGASAKLNGNGSGDSTGGASLRTWISTGDRGYELTSIPLSGARGQEPARFAVQIRAVELPLPEADTVAERSGLTPRQAEVALLLARRLSNREIATALVISPYTARRHTEVVLRRLGLRSRRGVRRRLLEGEPAR